MKERVNMDSKLIQEMRLEHQMNTLLKQIEYPIECDNRFSSICKQCIYNVGDVIPICSKTY